MVFTPPGTVYEYHKSLVVPLEKEAQAGSGIVADGVATPRSMVSKAISPQVEYNVIGKFTAELHSS